MKRAVVLSLLALLVSACAEVHAGPSALQRFDELRHQFRMLTLESRGLSSDVRRLNRSMQSGVESEVRAAAVRLKGDARAFVTRTGAAARSVHGLAVGARGRAFRGYLSLTAQTLHWDRLEGLTLTQLADATWLDPLVITVPDERRVRGLSGSAQQYAAMAVRSARTASRWRQRFATSFRYVPFPSPVPAAGAA